jgi:hypothetical protein
MKMSVGIPGRAMACLHGGLNAAAARNRKLLGGARCSNELGSAADRVTQPPAHACPGLLAHLREDRARDWTSAKGNRFKLRTASENSATIEPSKSGSWAAPSAAHASKR